MPKVDSSHYHIISDSITGHRDIDQQTITSVAVLEERLARLKKQDKIFTKIAFSPSVETLAGQRHRVSVS